MYREFEKAFYFYTGTKTYPSYPDLIRIVIIGSNVSNKKNRLKKLLLSPSPKLAIGIGKVLGSAPPGNYFDLTEEEEEILIKRYNIKIITDEMQKSNSKVYRI